MKRYSVFKVEIVEESLDKFLKKKGYTKDNQACPLEILKGMVAGDIHGYVITYIGEQNGREKI